MERISTKEIKAVHPSGLELAYNDDLHSYTDETGRSYVSVTTFIDQFFPKFPAAEVATRIAPKRGTTPAALLKEWEAESERGKNEGTLVHAYAEAVLTGKDWQPAPNVRVALLYKQATRAVVALLKRFEFKFAEKIVFSPTLGLAGTIDLGMEDREAGDLILMDWKQNKKIRRDNKWGQKALPPIQHLDDCEFNKYALQLALYARIIEGEGYFPSYSRQPYRAAIIHLRQDNYATINLAEYPMVDEINAMLDYV